MLRQEKDLHFNPSKVGGVGADLQVVLSIKQKCTKRVDPHQRHGAPGIFFNNQLLGMAA